ncbi:MAG: AMP-binding protein [Nitrospiraceae bacterium]|nr:AMP-binding protein [Nitrospiraceae bacterium]
MTENTGNLALRFLEAAEKFKQSKKPLFNYETTHFKDEAGFEKPIWEEKTLSYGEFIERAKFLAQYLQGCGISYNEMRSNAVGGTKVGLLLPSGPQWCIAFAGILLSGAIAVPINETAPEEDLKEIFADCRPDALFVNRQTIGLFAFTEDIRIIDLDCPEFSIEEEKETEKEKITKKPESGLLKIPSSQMDDPAVIIYTSGTTGLQKGVVLTHRNLLSDAYGIIETGIVGEKENVLIPLPFYHAYPLMCFLASFLSGASLTLLPPARSKELARVAKSRGVTIIIAVPQMLELLNASIKKKILKPLIPLLPLCRAVRGKTKINMGKAIFSKVHSALGGGLRLIGSGGARLDPEVMRALEALGFSIVEGYGLTETSPVVTFNPANRRKPGSAGKPVKGAQVKIEEGEVLLRGPMLMQGYWNKPEETARAIRNGWLHTGDTGRIDNEGYLYITGRKKEIIVLSSGKNISPEEVEKRYMESPLIKEIAVYEEAGSLKGIIVPEFDYAREHGIANLKEEMGWELMRIGQRLPSFMRLTGFSLSKTPLPKTPLGKIRRFRLGELLKEAAVEKKETGPEFLHGSGQKVARALNSAAGRKKNYPVRAEDNLELDLGLDSLKKIELLTALEDEFPPLSIQEKPEGQAIPDDFLLDVQTAGELLRKIDFLLSGEKPALLESGAEKTKKTKETKISAADKRQRLFFPGTKKISFSRAEKTASFLLYCLLKGSFRAVFRLESKGVQNIPAPPFILAPNHSSFLDGFIVTAALPRQTVRSLFFVGWERYFRGVVAHTLKVIHVIPLDREHLLGSALRSSAMVLRQGYSLCVFPEGGRSFDGALMELKPGIAAMALTERVPIVPVWIEGASRALPRGARMIKPVKIELRFGKPIYPADFEGRDEKKLLSALAERLNELSRGARGAPEARGEEQS